jgi:PAS domain S-box-containing protein
MKLTLERQIPLVFAIATLLLIVIVVFAFRSMNALGEALKWEKHTHEVINQLDDTLNLMLDAETGSRGFLITADETVLEPYNRAQQEIGGSLARLHNLTADNSAQTERVLRLENTARERLAILQAAVELRRTQTLEQVRANLALNRGRELMSEVRGLIGEMESEERALLARREAELEMNLQNTYRMLYLAGIAGVLSLGLANLAIFREIGKRAHVEDDLKETNRELERRVEERTAELSKINRDLIAEGERRELSEKKSSDSEMFTRTILDSLAAHIAVVNKDGEIVAVNEAWERFGSENCADALLPETSVGQNYLQVCRRSAAFEENTRYVLENLQQILSGAKKDFSFEYPCHSPTEERWFILQVNALQGGAGGAVISHINITDRKRAEVKLKNSEEFNRSIFENSPDCVHVLELDGTIHSVNAHGMQLMEVDDNADYIGKQWIDFWEDEENEAAYQAIQSASKGQTAELEGFRRTVKGTPKYWHASVSPIFDADGKPIRLISTSRDITDRREAEKERELLLKNEKAARKDAEIANRLRDEFLATVSHELRAPLNSILGWARLLEKGKLDQTTAEKAYNTIVRNAESQNRLIEDLLDVSRIISGKLRLEVMTVKPINIVESALETVRPAAEAKGIKVEIKGEADISHISGDPNRLQQVIWNLLSNAIKFTPPEGIVRLEIEREENFVEIRVKDTGVGIKEEFLPHVFDRFRQADASSIRKFGGLGLGLAIVRHITEMHGGTVHAYSAGENKGSTFVVRLPLIVQSDEENEAMELRRAAQTFETEPELSLDGMLILVVDDEEDTRQLLVQSLTFYGATVTTASSAAEAFDELQDKNPDVMVSDIGMPDEDGYSLIRRIRALPEKQHRDIPAIALTAFTRAQDRMRALTSGYQNHVAKPVEPDELATVIASLTGRLQINDADDLRIK